MKILLLGGTGAMGISLKSILASRGNEVYITSRSSHKPEEHIYYLQGDAHDDAFLSEVLMDRYDAIVDFMIWTPKEFEEKWEKLLCATDQYIFTSSSRVYANDEKPITERSPRLLDVCKDAAYLRTDEYALTKARSENILFAAKRKNWTIIRPYITYNINRLQLGVFEKELWLYRTMHGRSIILPKDVASHETTMTHGEDVAMAIVGLIGNRNAYGEVFNLTGKQHLKWLEILNIYLNVLEKETGERPNVYMPENSMEISRKMNNTTQVVYDRLFDRVFDNSKLQSVVGNLAFRSVEDGISDCLKNFIKQPEWRGHINARLEAYLCRKTGEKVPLYEFEGQSKFKYLGWYYVPGLMSLLKNVRGK